MVSEQSYPSKIITYIPSRTPILIHSKSDTSVYQDFKEYQCGFLLDSTNQDRIINTIKKIIKTKDDERAELATNAIRLFKQFFTPEKNKSTLLKAVDSKIVTRPRILEINNIDLPGHPWNGYDLMEHLNQHSDYYVNQICTYKLSKNPDVVKIYNSQAELDLEFQTLNYEADELSVHSCVSVATPAVLASSSYQNANLLHFHLIHNMKLSLFSLIEMCNQKPAIISIHDPWIFTGHCVHFGDCAGYLTGCMNCQYLDSMFPIKYDTANMLWRLKQFVYDHIDVDFVVSTKYMYDLFKSSPLTKKHRVHLIPFGMDINKFTTVSREAARKKYHIPEDNIVLFHRAQKEFKGTNFFVDALKQLETNRKITIITCNETGLLDEIKDDYEIIELGFIDDTELANAYNACDIFVMPSIGESFGMMAVEAMSCSKPVICFNNTALPSVTFAPECGIAAENLNSTKLMEAIKYLTEDDKERKRRGTLARKIVEENYSVESYNKKMKDLYDKALKRHHKGFSLSTGTVHQTEDVTILMGKLNRLTKHVLPRSSRQCKELLYKDVRYSSIKNKIDFGSLDVQLTLDQYNKSLYNLYKDYLNVKPKYLEKKYLRFRHLVKLSGSLLLRDRKTLLKAVKKHLRIKERTTNDKK